MRSGEVFRDGLKGIEKESLRVGPDGAIAMTPHPTTLGSALTHPTITTDYSEALLEFVTGAAPSSAKVIEELERIHRFVYPQIGNESLWVTSMPCVLATDDNIPVASYGTSNVGRMKHVYRIGLGYRYGRAMQAIAGIHFNYSPPGQLWKALSDGEDGLLREETDDRYMGMLRNLKRSNWIIAYLFGSSPAVCKSFVRAGGAGLRAFDRATWYYPHGTSLRLSDFGYSNRTGGGLAVSYDSLKDYAAGLRHAIDTPHPPYQRIGVKRDGEYLQLNANLLQIENEYYSYVRPKRTPVANEKRTTALEERGIEYVELRSLDLDPWAPAGISEASMLFLEAYMLQALLEPSPIISPEQQVEIDDNLVTMACRGRDTGITLQRDGDEIAMVHWAGQLLDRIEAVCELLDTGLSARPYAEALRVQRVKVEDPSATPSARVLREMRDGNESFYHFALRCSTQLREQALSVPLTGDELQAMQGQVERSLADQTALENGDAESFEEYLRQYFGQR
ncbi:MAG: glutamate--cysteine ligase [Chromatiales bacterium]|nr:glutamate--cysteine ligase [Chromatiales bacterium]